ncbi:tryptophan 7-halogenase [Microbulbifer bruguierae]|uniref:Tryptophan 7-halogenase n=1 Tax=Microbulbifer bruguierae TaxID=3029061 RepID=A0ABY8NL85_9GAMM|nr:tryptophan 7-halogenase [Microbulbifer bruguierae]WGL18378.1 tryptophan 7-halogenase [Microbulbifer bruguierae]
MQQGAKDPKSPIKVINIVGGGTAGWMAAATLARHFRGHDLSIRLVESEQIGTIGVGEATVPSILNLNRYLGIRERDFIAATGATFKLGIEFSDWYTAGESFFHPFADFGAPLGGIPFYPCWLKQYKLGNAAPLSEYSLATALAKGGRFAQPDPDTQNPLALYNYAYHFDASRYAALLRRIAESHGVRRIEGKIVEVRLDSSNGDIRSLHLQSGEILHGDLYIDCSGFRGLLIEQALATGYEDWRHWLPVDTAVAVQSERAGPAPPYTRATATAAGWRWRIPLQHRNGNGHVFSSAHMTTEQASTELLKNLEGSALGEQRVIRFAAGMRKKFWNRNCVALGLASGFIEPLESTSISLIQTGVEKILKFLPDLIPEQKNIDEANRLNRQEYERVRDFIILHYKLNGRDDTQFWRDMRDMAVPDTLQQKMDAFTEDGRLLSFEQESFQEASWLAIYDGFQFRPRNYLAEVDKLDNKQVIRAMENMRHAIATAATHAPPHHTFLRQAFLQPQEACAETE